LRELIISKRKLKVISIDERRVKADYDGAKIVFSRGKWNKLMKMKSKYVKLYLSDDNIVIAVTSKRYFFIDNKLLWESLRKMIPLGWEIKYEKIDELILHARYILPQSIGFDQRPLFVLFNLNDGKTPIKAYYGYYTISCGNGILTEEISLSRRLGHWNIVIYEIAKAIKNWKIYVEKLIKKRNQMYEKISRENALKIAEWFHEKKLILKRHLDKIKTKLFSMDEELYIWDFANLICCIAEEDREFLENDLRWIKLERTIGKLVTSKDEFLKLI